MKGSLQHKLGQKLHFLGDSENIDASMVLSPDGLLLASDIDPDISAENIASMMAIMRNSAEMALEAMDRGLLDVLYIETVEGAKIITMGAGTRAVVTALLDHGADMGSSLAEVQDVAEAIRSILE